VSVRATQMLMATRLLNKCYNAEARDFGRNCVAQHSLPQVSKLYEEFVTGCQRLKVWHADIFAHGEPNCEEVRWWLLLHPQFASDGHSVRLEGVYFLCYPIRTWASIFSCIQCIATAAVSSVSLPMFTGPSFLSHDRVDCAGRAGSDTRSDTSTDVASKSFLQEPRRRCHICRS
jgi:hypothetical protein